MLAGVKVRSAFAVTTKVAPCADDAVEINSNAARATSDKPEIRRAEPAEVRKHRRKIRAGNAEPTRQRSGVLIDRERRDDLAITGVVGIIVSLQARHGAVKALTVHRAADHEMVSAPTVIGAAVVALQR